LVGEGQVCFLTAVGDGYHVGGLVDAAHELALPATNCGVGVCLIKIWVIPRLVVS
jgi:hypothetical protein